MCVSPGERPRKLYAERALNLPLGAELITGNMWYCCRIFIFLLLFISSFPTCFHLLLCLFLLLLSPYCLFHLLPNDHHCPCNQVYPTNWRQPVLCMCCVCTSTVTCCQHLQTQSVRMAWVAVTPTALSSDASSLRTGFDHEGHTPRSFRCSSAFTFFVLLCKAIVSMIYLAKAEDKTKISLSVCSVCL